MNRNLSILNFLSVLLVIILNYYSQAVKINNNTIGSLSNEYENLFTPAGYAFAIWGLIFLSLLAYASFQIYKAFSDKDADFISKTGPWFIIANVANAAWVVVWLLEYTGISVILMFVILFSLLRIVLNTNMERWDAPLKIIAFTWWPICLYAGWITVATIANVSAYLSKIEWDGWIFNETQWTIIMILIAGIINILMIYKRNMREFAAVAVWALFAIYVRHQDGNLAIAYTALAGAIIVFISLAYHGFLNRKTNPFSKLLNKS
ncbi:MAG: tryptophan-rich sensory protein [Gillisia sp.]